MPTDSRVTPTGLIKVTLPDGEAHIDPAFIAMIARGSSGGSTIHISGVAGPVQVTEAPPAILALLKEGRAVQAVMRRASSES